MVAFEYMTPQSRKKREMDGDFEENLRIRADSLSPKNLPLQPDASHSDDPRRRLRKQWFQENDLDLYSKSSSLDIQNGFENEFNDPEMHMLQGNSAHFENSKIASNKGSSHGQEDNLKNKEHGMLPKGLPLSDCRDKPCWLKDNVQEGIEPNNFFIEGSSKHNHKQQNQNKFVINKIPDQPLSGNKSPFANDYKQEGTLMSESSSAYGTRGSNSIQDINSGDIINSTSNRLRNHRPQPAEMFKLLSFGYSGNYIGAGDADENDEHQRKSNPMNSYGHHTPYKPTCIEKAENRSTNPNQKDIKPNGSCADDIREQSASFGKKKLSFDEGRPDFFNILHGSEKCKTEQVGIQPPDGVLSRMFSKDSRTNFRRRKVDVNAPTPQGPLRPPLRR